MDKGPRNEGIYITGGSINAEQMAVGRRAQATRILYTANDALEQKGLTEIRDKLDGLLKEITTNADSLHNPDEVLDSTNAVAEELAKDKPNKLTIVGILKGIVESTGSVARGEANYDSDIDLLVVFDEIERSEKRNVTVGIRSALAHFPVPKDVIVTDVDEIRRRGHLVGPMLCPALEEGRVAYERS